MSPGTITGETRLAGVLGHPVRYSLSPLLHNAAYRALGLDVVYVALPVEPANVAVAVEAIRTFDMLGVSVTIPLKETVIGHLDQMSDPARMLGAVNCISNTGGTLTGHNTDGAGFVASLGEVGFDPAGESAVVFGAGGSAKAVAVGLVDAGASTVTVVNRSPRRAEELAALLPNIVVGDASSIHDAALVVNATPVGMASTDATSTPFDVGLLSSHHFVADLVYHPLDTALLNGAADQGATVVRGTGMLLHQAAEQIRLWTGEVAPLGAMRAALDSR